MNGHQWGDFHDFPLGEITGEYAELVDWWSGLHVVLKIFETFRVLTSSCMFNGFNVRRWSVRKEVFCGWRWFWGHGNHWNHGTATCRFDLACPHRPLNSQSKRKQGSTLGHEWPWYVGEDVRKWWNQGKGSSPTGWRNPLTSWSFAAMDAKITTQAGGIYVQVLPNWRLTGGLPIFLNLVLCHSISMTKETRDASRSRICARTSAAGLVNQPSKPLVNCKPTWENRIWVEKPVYSLQVPSGKLT